MKQIIHTSKAPEPIGPYSQAILAGNTLYISGQIAINPTTGNIENSTLEAETKMVLSNLKAVLEAGGMTEENVVKCSIFLKSMNDFAEVNKLYGAFFKKNSPARETVEVSKLPKDVRVEISAIAVK